MPVCTIVEWDQDLGAEGWLDPPGEHDAPPSGSMVRFFGASDSGTFAIELWDSSEEARRFSAETAPSLSQSAWPPPTRVTGLETSWLYLR